MLDEMFKEVYEHEQQRSEIIDFILVCGDCQTIRHADDLQCLSVPVKYRKIGDFPDYYSGKKTVPKLTIFVGGNHECSNYLMTLPYGGWVCDNMYYMGYSGVIRYRGLRIAGISGIFNQPDCNRGRFERMPLNQSTIRSIYHTRKLDVYRLQLLQERISSNPIDVMLSHDWPVKVYDYGNKQQLLRFKPGFKQDMESKQGLGNPLTRPLIFQLKPRRWFAAHLHCRFSARIIHGEPDDNNEDNKTEFLSLDKIENKYKNNRRNYFMEILDIEPMDKNAKDDDRDNIYHDPEWLTILRKTAHLERYTYGDMFCPRLDEPSGQAFYPSDEDIEKTKTIMSKKGLKIEMNFRMVEPVIYDRPGNVQVSLDTNRRLTHSNFQTDDLCSRLGIQIPEYLICPIGTKSLTSPSIPTSFSQNYASSTSSKKFKIDEKMHVNIKKEEGEQQQPQEDEDCLDFYIDTRGEP